MPTVSLKDGSKRHFDQALTVADIAKSISSGLAKAAIAANIGGKLVDLSFLVDTDCELQILTTKDEAALEVLRHSSAHLLAHAVKQLFPEAQVTIGPVIEDGFYYDFAYDRPFTPEDLQAIEKRMKHLAKSNYPVQRETISREAAIDLFASMGEHYKCEIIQDLPEGETLTLYRQSDFVDLCRGPHVPSTAALKAFKLTKLAGAYWRGDAKNAMLQRIYGTAWESKASLDAYLKRLEEAKLRDHREVGKKMQLFHLQQEAPGMVFWHPRGWSIVVAIRQYLRRTLKESDYQEINTPQLVDLSLWEASGHLAKFDDGIFTTTEAQREYAVKPMNCPCHVQVFNQGLKSYRDLPIRYAEYGTCHRNEPSGTLHGLMRVRRMVQDDGHIFCTEAQIQGEVRAFIDQLHKTYRHFGFQDIQHKLSTRPEKRVGSDELWDKAENALAEALNASDVDWVYLPGEGAFYGPKIEFSLKDCLGRVWQCGTIQVDFSMPSRLGAEYVDEHGEKQSPVMLHRAILGSFERFIAILIEHYAGRLPDWLAPVQVVIMNISDKHAEKVSEIRDYLQNRGVRVISDLRNEKIGYKIREHSIARVPYHLVIGDKELESGTVSVKHWGESLGELTIEHLANRLTTDHTEEY